MNWWLPHNFEQKRFKLEQRAIVFKALRQFFDQRDFTEVQTPALQVCPVMDAHIHAFQTQCMDVGRSRGQEMYLHTSPEFDMKKLLAAGMERIYQICPVYRNAEGSALHSPEFTLLEWYRVGVDYSVLMNDCESLLQEIARSVEVDSYVYKGVSCDPFQPIERICVVDAFKRYADLDLEACLDDREMFARYASEADVRVSAQDRWDDIFHAVMAAHIEPHLGRGVPCVLYDYPVSMAALSRRREDDPRFAERFELYVCGIELANAFSELTDANEQRRRYEGEMATKKALYGEIYPADEQFFEALEYMPESAGIALGVDRLVMLATGAQNIDDVLWAPVQIL
ncbi:MAG: EF-P lysine aminoacylase EpmA [Alphaproteobacteria bacterium]